MANQTCCGHIRKYCQQCEEFWLHGGVLYSQQEKCEKTSVEEKKVESFD